MSITRCPHCGTANRAGSNFCNSCGTDLRQIDSRPISADEPGGEAIDTPAPVQRDSWLEPGVDAVPPDDDAGEPEPAASPPSAALPGAELDTLLAGQPWLRLEFSGEDEDSAEDETESLEVGAHNRLLAGIQGLLDPVRVRANVSDDTVATEITKTPAPLRAEPELSADRARIVRTLLTEKPLLSSISAPLPTPPPRRLRTRWIVVLLSLALLVPALSDFTISEGIPAEWPGVADGYRTIQEIPADTLVLLFWAYDPATSGELDLVSLPVVRHLLERRVRLAIVSLLPGGPATARRLVSLANAERRRNTDLVRAADFAWTIPYRYLSGGAAVLPLLGQSPEFVLRESPSSAVPAQTISQEASAEPASLAVLFAAEAEDVQYWLEMVQPLNQVPVVAVTSAGADPVLRPYLDSGQLSGLISGFDGAFSYRQYLDRIPAGPEVDWLAEHIRLQNWGHFTLIALIALGQIRSLFGRETGR